MRTKAALAACLVTVLLASGCTTADGGTPTPTTSSANTTGSPSSTNSDDRNGAPPVENPLNPDKYVANPCAALAAAQAPGFGVSPPGTPTTTGATAETVGPWCSWEGDDRFVGVYFPVANKNGLADVYGARDRDEYFEPTTISGYPAVFRDQVDSRPRGLCSISVGVTDQLYFRAESQENIDDTLACTTARKLATAVIATMKEGA
jgi:hypothetical protein